MSKGSGWRSLQLSNLNGPALLIKAQLDAASSTIHLTDLSRVWAEKLNKTQLEQRAVDDGCSIDPTDDSEQYEILLSKIQAALDGGPKTSRTLSHDSNNDTLTLHLSAPLPSPLPPLQWKVILHPLPFDHVGSLLISPLVQYSSSLQDEIQSLIAIIHDKDRVIAKIADRLETSGNDLTTVFPGTSNIKISRKRPQRDQLARYIEGLAQFESEQWRAELNNTQSAETLSSDRLDRIFDGLHEVSALPSFSGAPNGWWRSLDDDTSAAHRMTATPHSSDHEQPDATEPEIPAADPDETVLDDDFQRQATPPTLQQESPNITANCATPSPSNDRSPNVPEDESTADEESDLDAPVQKPRKKTKSPKAPIKPQGRLRKSPTPQEGQPDTTFRSAVVSSSNGSEVEKPRMKLGAIGGRAKAPAPGSATNRSTTQAKNPLGRFGGKTEPVASLRTEEETTAAPRSKLGALGGKAKTSKAEVFTTDKTNERSPGKGIKNSTEFSTAQSEEVSANNNGTGTDMTSRGRSAIKEESSPPRETSEERANRKREELKRGLEEKAKVPVKKKRKF